LSVGERNRVVARTTLNKHSSRSHIIFCVNIESFPAEDTGSGSKSNSFIQRSNLNLVDLAGSESVRHRSAHSTENRRKEGGSINKRLVFLFVLSRQMDPSTLFYCLLTNFENPAHAVF
jgi:kinesin family protein 15